MFFKKVKKSAEQIIAESLPNRKKVQYDPIDIEKIAALMKSDALNMLEFVPINYYKNKLRFAQGTFYFNEDYSVVFVRFEEYVNDKFKAGTEFFKIDYETMKKALRKFGQNI